MRSGHRQLLVKARLRSEFLTKWPVLTNVNASGCASESVDDGAESCKQERATCGLGEDEQEMQHITFSAEGQYVLQAFEAMQKRVSLVLKVFTDEELQSLAISSRYYKCPAGTVLVQEGECKACMYLVVKGVFSVGMQSAATGFVLHMDAISDDTFSIQRDSVARNSFLKSPSVPLTQQNNGHLIEIMRIHHGEAVNELCLLEGKPSEAKITALIQSIVMEINADSLLPLLIVRSSFQNILSPGERTMMSLQKQLQKLWLHLVKTSEMSETVNLSKIELGHTRVKVHKKLLQSKIMVSAFIVKRLSC